ncbi:hypothetical protein ACWIUD_07440 [Helicobacter sp. 23-1044]
MRLKNAENSIKKGCNLAESLAKKCQIHKSKLYQSKRHRQIHARQKMKC